MAVVANYQCPQCGAPLAFSAESQKWDCGFCLGSFEREELDEAKKEPKTVTWNESEERKAFSPEEIEHMRLYQCPQCSAQMMAEETCAASACPYCGNMAIFTAQVEGALQPNWLIPFQKTRKEAEEAYKKFCKGKRLVPKSFFQESNVEKISGVYVPFWMFDCGVKADIRFNATKQSRWEDANYRYTRIDHYAVRRKGSLAFASLPVDASGKMDDDLMGAVEPYDLDAKKDFDGAYLSGFLAERYDQTAEEVYPRAESRIKNSTHDVFSETVAGYTTVTAVDSDMEVEQGRCQYAMLPVWLLSTRYKDQVYTFAMNGQTGKFVGNLPVSAGKAAAWFIGLAAGFTSAAYGVVMLLAEMGVL